LGKILHSQSASLHPRLSLGSGELNAKIPAMDWHALQGE